MKEKGKAQPVDIYVGSRLRARRTMVGLSQTDLGKKIGVTFQQIQKYEKGINRMGSSRLYAFARILSVPVSYFFDGYEQSEGLEPINDPLGKETAKLIKEFMLIPDATVRKSVISLAKSLSLAGGGK